MNVAWISYLDAEVYTGGGELTQRGLIRAGRARGHRITLSAYLRRRPQRALRRIGLHRSLRVDWSADCFVLANINNAPHLNNRIPSRVLTRALDSGKAVMLQNGWVDVCPLDVPCLGDRSKCPSACDRSFGNRAFGAAKAAIFVSPLHRDVSLEVLDVSLSSTGTIYPMIDPDRFRPLGLERDIDVLYVGTISREKGYYNLVERFGPERLTFAGRNMLGHPVQGTYLGEVANDDLPQLYNRARTFAHLPEWLEPQGRTVTEASLCGCEVITNDRVGATSFGREHLTDPAVVRGHPNRFWADLERMIR